MEFASLEYLWWGVCIGGKHYTGSVRHGKTEVELTRKLGLKEAKQMAEETDRLWLPLERETNKFNSLAQLERYAVKWCEVNLGDEWLLQHYDNNNPWHPVAGKGYIVPRLRMLRKISKIWDKHHNNDEMCKRIYKIWFDLIEK